MGRAIAGLALGFVVMLRGALNLTLVGPEGQVVSYHGQAVPRGAALRAFFLHGWRLKDRHQLAAASGSARGGDQTQSRSR